MPSKIALADFLDSLSIDSATSSTFEAIVDAGYTTLDQILALTGEQLGEIRLASGGRIGSRGHNMYASLHSERVQALLPHAAFFLDLSAPSKTYNVSFKVASEEVAGKNVVVTGAGPADRKILSAMLKDAGAIVQSATRANTHMLICEDINSTTSKAREARRLNVPVRSYAEIFIPA